MLDIKLIVENATDIESMLKNRGDKDLIPLVGKIIELDTERKKTLREVEALKTSRNSASLEIATFKKEKKDASKKSYPQ